MILLTENFSTSQMQLLLIINIVYFIFIRFVTVTTTGTGKRRKRDLNGNLIPNDDYWNKNIQRLTNVQTYIHQKLNFTSEYRIQVIKLY